MAQQTGYITAAEYATTTERSETEATPARVTRASRLLDARIGFHARKTAGDYTGWRVDLGASTVEAYQVDAIKEWVAWLVAYLFDSSDQLDRGGDSVTLGRFSVTKSVVKDTGLPAKMQLVDGQLVDSGMIRVKVGSVASDLPVA